MPEENLLATLENSLRQTRYVRSRLASRLVDLENEAERLVSDVEFNTNPRLELRRNDLLDEANRVRTEVNEIDAVINQTEAALFRIISSMLKEQSSSAPTNTQVETTPLRDSSPDPASQPVHTPPVEAPARAQSFLCLLLDAKDQKVVIGDLIERYEVKVNRRGKKHADRWFYYEVARSVWPFVCRLVMRISGRITRTRRAE